MKIPLRFEKKNLKKIISHVAAVGRHVKVDARMLESESERAFTSPSYQEDVEEIGNFSERCKDFRQRGLRVKCSTVTAFA